MSGYIAGASVGAIAAAAAKKKREREEERMTTYNKNDLDGWEFKIVRSSFGRFSSREAIEKVCREEARSGWELLEKFDSHRLRFKRRVDKRGMDGHLENDPYRTEVGMGEKGILIFALGLAILLAGVFLAVYYLK